MTNETVKEACDEYFKDAAKLKAEFGSENRFYSNRYFKAYYKLIENITSKIDYILKNNPNYKQNND